MNRPIFAMEIGPLCEPYHTGIGNVAKNLAIELLCDSTVEARFYVGRQAIPPRLVERVVAAEGGVALHWFAGRADYTCDRPEDLQQGVTGLFTQHKFHRRFFTREVLILHDLTTLVTPRFHSSESVAFENSRRLADVTSSDLIVTVSESTRLDLRTYHPEAAHIPCIVAPLAPCTTIKQPSTTPGMAEPYVFVLGTLEPRKSIESVLQILSSRTEELAQFRFIFAGRWGWGPSAKDMIVKYDLAPLVDSGQIKFAGFLSDASRDTLIMNAKAVIYASRYEGFGLPILEALQFGIPVITGHGSSLPEAGGDVVHYCDVTSVDALRGALTQCLRQPISAQQRQRQAWANQFSWVKTYQIIRDAALQ